MSFSADKSPDRITPGKPLEPAGAPPQTPKDFSSYMQGSAPQGPKTAQASTAPSPAELARSAGAQTTSPSFNTLITQARSAQDSLGTVEKQLKEPNLKLKRSQAHLVKNKLTDANEYIRAAAGKVGVEPGPMKTATGAAPIDRFIAYVNDGQNQLIEVERQLKEMSSRGQQLNAADMLSITVKMNLAQQEIEYSSTLLAKVIDSIKQMINVQL